MGRADVITIQSFGYRHEPPPCADITIDLRDRIRDPHIDPMMRRMTGLDEAVRRHVLNTPGTRELIGEILAQINTLPAGQPVTVQVGCQGGRHRSVVVAAEVARRLNERGVAVSLSHRHVTRPVIDAAESR